MLKWLRARKKTDRLQLHQEDSFSTCTDKAELTVSTKGPNARKHEAWAQSCNELRAVHCSSAWLCSQSHRNSQNSIGWTESTEGAQRNSGACVALGSREAQGAAVAAAPLALQLVFVQDRDHAATGPDLKLRPAVWERDRTARHVQSSRPVPAAESIINFYTKVLLFSGPLTIIGTRTFVKKCRIQHKKQQKSMNFGT